MSAYSAMILARPGIQAYYRLDETSGSIARDLTGNGYNATLSGGFTANQPGVIFEDSDAAVLLSAPLGTLTLPNSLGITTWTAISIEAWVAYQYTTVTCDGSNTLIYLNGSPASSGSGAAILVGGLMDFVGTPGTALFDEVAIYKNTVLTQAQITQSWQTSGRSSMALFPTMSRRTGTFPPATRRQS